MNPVRPMESVWAYLNTSFGPPQTIPSVGVSLPQLLSSQLPATDCNLTNVQIELPPKNQGRPRPTASPNILLASFLSFHHCPPFEVLRFEARIYKAENCLDHTCLVPVSQETFCPFSRPSWVSGSSRTAFIGLVYLVIYLVFQ